MFSNSLRSLLLASALLAAPAGASAQVVNEVGDAGQLLGTAQIITGSVTTINGVLENLGNVDTFVHDTDLYRISITNPGAFSVTVSTSLQDLYPVPFPGADDTELFLFDSGGILLAYSDDQIGPYSADPIFKVGDIAGLVAGDYYLAFNIFSIHPTFANGPFGYGPTGGVEGPLTGWSGLGQAKFGAYTLSLTGVGMGAAIDNGPPRGVGAVPEPGTWALMILGFGAAGAALHRAQSRRSALRPA